MILLSMISDTLAFLPMIADTAQTQPATQEAVLEAAAVTRPLGTAMMRWICYISLFILSVLSVPFIWRSMKGPTVFDRIVGLNGIGTLMPVMLVLVGVVYDRTDMFIDLAIGIFLLNLILTLMLGKFVREKVRVLR